MVKAAFVLGLHEQSPLADVKPRQTHGLVSAIRRAVRLEAVDVHLGRGMLVCSRLSPERWEMATGAIGLGAEEGFATFCGRRIEVHTRGGAGRRQRQLVILQS